MKLTHLQFAFFLACLLLAGCGNPRGGGGSSSDDDDLTSDDDDTGDDDDVSGDDDDSSGDDDDSGDDDTSDDDDDSGDDDDDSGDPGDDDPGDDDDSAGAATDCPGSFSGAEGPGCCSMPGDMPDLGRASCQLGVWTCAAGDLCSCGGDVAEFECLDSCDGTLSGLPGCVFSDHWECFSPTPVSSDDCN